MVCSNKTPLQEAIPRKMCVQENCSMAIKIAVGSRKTPRFVRPVHLIVPAAALSRVRKAREASKEQWSAGGLYATCRSPKNFTTGTWFTWLFLDLMTSFPVKRPSPATREAVRKMEASHNLSFTTSNVLDRDKVWSLSIIAWGFKEGTLS